MSALKLSPPGSTRRQRALDVGLAVLGVLVVVTIVYALGHRESGSASAAAAAVQRTVQTATAPTGPAATGPAATSAPPTTASTTTAPSKTASPTTAPSKTASPTTARLPLVVLNNTAVTGLAAGARARFVQGGWVVTSVGNYRNDIVSTCAYYDPAVAGAVQSAQALQKQFPAVKRVLPRFAQLPSAPVVVVLTPDYS